MKNPLSIALPKGRLLERIIACLKEAGIEVAFGKRELVCFDEKNGLKFLLVKNNDLTTYVHHGIAGLGICGEDRIIESGYRFYKLLEFPFGATRLCLAGRRPRQEGGEEQRLKVATKFPRFTQTFFLKRGIPVEMIKLEGSVELAPVLGLAPYIVDLVETGSTLKAHGLEVLEELAEIKVALISNPAYYKLEYQNVDHLVHKLGKQR
jgi:ATP phosphoribosyltransferase